MILKSEEKIVSLCKKHPRAVYFDGKICPACKAEAEFMALTDKSVDRLQR